jgi:hypothetical protein
MEGTSSYDFGAPRRLASPSPMGVSSVGLAPAQLPRRGATPLLLLAAAAAATPDTGRVPLVDIHEHRSDLAAAPVHRQEGSSSGLMAATHLALWRAVQTLKAAVAHVLASIRVSRDNVDSRRRRTDRRRQAQGVPRNFISSHGGEPCEASAEQPRGLCRYL